MFTKKMSGDYFWTLVTQILVGITGVLLVIIISRNYSTESYGEYYLVKRVSDITWLISLFGLTVSIPRNRVFIEKVTHDLMEKVIVLITPISIIFFLLISKLLSYIFLGNLHEKYYIMFVVLVLGMILYGINYAYYRSLLKFKISNIIQILNYCIVPFSSLLLSSDIISFINLYSILILIVNLLLFVMSFYKYIPGLLMMSKQSISKIMKDTNFVLKYGLQRLPGLLFAGLIFTLPVSILNWYGAPNEVGLLSQLFQILSLVNMPINSLGLLLLPNVSKMVAEKKSNEVKDSTIKLIRKINVLVIPISIALLFLSKFIINFLNDYEIGYTDIYYGFILLGIIPMTFYNLLRNIIDAADSRPYSTIIVITALLGTTLIGVVMNVLFPDNVFLLVLILSFINFLFLGILSLFVCKKLILNNEI